LAAWAALEKEVEPTQMRKGAETKRGQAATESTPSPSVEERGRERWSVCLGSPLSSVLSPLLRRGERKQKLRARIFASRDDVGR
jgi:hypothetical protein